MINFFSITVAFFMTISLCGQCNLTYTSIDPLCNGVCNGQVTLFPTGSAPFIYTWSNGDTAETVDSLCAGTYTVSMVDDLGCSASVSITITEPSIPFTVDTYLVSNSSVSGPCEGQIGWTTSGGQPDYTINWYDCNTMNLYTNLPYFCAGEYFCVFIDDYGCIDTSDCVTVTNNVVGISEETFNGFSIYPNPFQNEINLSNTGIKVNQLTIYSVDGREVFNQKIENQNSVDVSDLPAGVYVVAVSSEEGIFTVKILKE